MESAHRASMLHKKRTGKALNITREIVEKEAMYEEVDERYQEKRLRMLQAQNMQIEAQFQRQLLAAFAAGAKSTRLRPAAHATHAHRASTGGVTKMRLDLPATRASFAEGSCAGSLLTSPTPASPGCVSTPAMTFAESPTTPCVQTPGAYAHGLPSPRAQIPPYVAQPSPTWQPQMQPQQASMQSVDAWRHRVLQQAQPSREPAAQSQAYRARLASAPELPLQPLSPVTAAEEAAKAARAQSEPSPLASRDRGVPSELLPNLPGQEISFTEAWQTPELCPSPPSTSNKSPVSPCAKDDSAEADSTTKQGFVMSTGALDPDFDEFTRFAFGLGNSTAFQEPPDTSVLDDWVSFDLDFATAA